MEISYAPTRQLAQNSNWYSCYLVSCSLSIGGNYTAAHFKEALRKFGFCAKHKFVINQSQFHTSITTNTHAVFVCETFFFLKPFMFFLFLLKKRPDIFAVHQYGGQPKC